MKLYFYIIGISLEVVNDDKKWKKFVKSLQANLELLQQGGGAGGPDVTDIFGVTDPKFANILKGIGSLEKDIEQITKKTKTTESDSEATFDSSESLGGGKKAKRSSSKRTTKSSSSSGSTSKSKSRSRNVKQSYQSASAAL
jgi:hypothetical protein